ncbi:Glycosyltransferase [hydrothermal vent metagenome]|uniref:Glycosyltransferase n=1 Tax=hydrothermal vent metagenome TaxID=652676 RepID=A0A1W1EHX7_9ZZZZ
MDKKVISIFDRVGIKAGMDYYDMGLAKGLENNDCKCTIYSNFDSKYSKKFYKILDNKGNLYKLFSHINSTIKASRDAKKSNSKLVIIHLFNANFQTLLTILIAKLFRLKVAVIAHDISSFINNDNSFIQNKIYNSLANYIIVHNRFSYNELIPYIKEESIHKVSIFKHGGFLDFIDKNISKEMARYKLGLDKDKKYILFFGQIKKVKGLDILIEALSFVSDDIELIIAGKVFGDNFNNYDMLIKELGLRDRVVKMIRFITNEERELLLFASDVNVLPYKKIYQSGVLLISMSHSLSVIASDLESNRDIIESGKNGLLFKSEDVKDLSSKIELFFDKSNDRERMSKEAYKTIRDDYSWSDIAKGYMKLIDE